MCISVSVIAIVMVMVSFTLLTNLSHSNLTTAAISALDQKLLSQSSDDHCQALANTVTV